ncbi:MAG TPA: hypothetical protein VD836_01055, partial [Solirubrobacteraceae bacterium]|nr:hypothetical protein [Solirubrobacteraceae bacterium]
MRFDPRPAHPEHSSLGDPDAGGADVQQPARVGRHPSCGRGQHGAGAGGAELAGGEDRVERAVEGAQRALDEHRVPRGDDDEREPGADRDLER